MRRVRDDERGGMAIFLALLMPILFGAAAIAIDVAAIWSARQQTQTGADAAVLAVAMDCARGNCGDIKKTAEDAFWANNEAAKLTNLGPGEGWIRVNGRKVSATQKTNWVVDHFFASALGYDTGELSADSYAEWAPTSSARSDVPLTISRCYDAWKSRSAVELPLATGPAGECTPGTALTAVNDGAACGTRSTWKTQVASSSTLPSGCTSSHLSGLVGKDIVLPVFDQATGSGSTQTFRVYGYAAFRVTSYNASTKTLRGHFTTAPRQVDATTPPAPGAPDLGARSVYLTAD